MNYSTVFLIALAFGSGIYALRALWRAYATYSLAYLRYFSIRLAADFILTMAFSALYLAGMPLYSVDRWSHGNVLLTLLFALGVASVFIATDAQVATVQSLASIRRRRFTLGYGLLLAGIAATAGIIALSGSQPATLVADRAMLLFTILSRSLALGFSIVIIAWAGSETTKTARRARVLAGCYFIFIEGSWLALYGLGMAGYLPARLYDGLHLTRMLAVNAVVVMYLGMFLDASVGTRVADGNHEALDPHLIKRFGITKREGEIIQQLCLGKSNEEIGEILFISTRTVKGHLYRIFRKTNVKNRVQLANLFGERVRKIGESEER